MCVIVKPVPRLRAAFVVFRLHQPSKLVAVATAKTDLVVEATLTRAYTQEAEELAVALALTHTKAGSHNYRLPRSMQESLVGLGGSHGLLHTVKQATRQGRRSGAGAGPLFLGGQ